MRARTLHTDGEQRTVAIVLSTGDEAVACLKAFAEREHVRPDDSCWTCSVAASDALHGKTTYEHQQAISTGGTGGSQTHRWRKVDSNFPFRAVARSLPRCAARYPAGYEARGQGRGTEQR